MAAPFEPAKVPHRLDMHLDIHKVPRGLDMHRDKKT